MSMIQNLMDTFHVTEEEVVDALFKIDKPLRKITLHDVREALKSDKSEEEVRPTTSDPS